MDKKSYLIPMCLESLLCNSNENIKLCNSNENIKGLSVDYVSNFHTQKLVIH